MRSLRKGIVLLVLCAAPAVAQTGSPPTEDTSYVDYHDSPLSLPLGVGLRTPAYDRVDGLSLPWGPRLELGDWLRADGLVTYRSHLGDFDPSLDVDLHPSEAHEVTLFAGRRTFTNDDWIRSDLANAVASFFVGSDARNYFRADRAEAKYKPSVRMGAFAVTPMVGVRFENDWSTGSLSPRSVPWSFFGRSDSVKMKRPNPPVTKGHVASALAGAGFAVDQATITGKIAVTVEHAFKAPVVSSFTQTTLNANVTFPTFGTQRFTARAHAVLSSGGLLPQQRYAYLGGGGTLATVDLLRIGGDRLFFAQGDYYVPINRITVPYLGSPYVDVRYAAGNAGVGGWPSLIQNVGIGAGISYLRADYTIDPARSRSPYSKRSDFSIGLSLTK